jgi:alpha-ketoglutarate-dependent taurine dioxygenase
MKLAINQLHPLFAGEVSGIDVGRPLDAATVTALDEAIDRYAVLVFRRQSLDDERQMAFARNFGELELPRSGVADVKLRLRPEMADISNLDEEQRVRGRDDPRRFDQLGNRLWHTDGSFRRIPAALSMLYAHRVPGPSPKGNGETEFADMRAAYDALSEQQKEDIAGLVALHDIAWSARLQRAAVWREERAAAGAATGSAHASRLEAQSAIRGGARIRDRRHAGAGRAPLAARADRARHPARVRLPPRLARGRSGNLGQPGDHASRPRL